MKVVILAGGMGTRLSEETVIKPKPMVEIGDKPILWHIMKWYADFGFQEFVICCGYKGHMIKEYFLNYNSRTENNHENWKVTLADTGLMTKTAGRILKIREYLKEEPFMLTYGDGVSDVDMVMEPGVFDYMGTGEDMLEDMPFEMLAQNNQMNAYRHEGFWSPMDTVHDRAYLERLWEEDRAPWKVKDEING